MLGGKYEEEKDIIDIEFTEQKADPENDENVIDLRLSDVQEKYEEDIAKANLMRAYNSMLIKNPEKVTGGL